MRRREGREKLREAKKQWEGRYKRDSRNVEGQQEMAKGDRKRGMWKRNAGERIKNGEGEKRIVRQLKKRGQKRNEREDKRRGRQIRSKDGKQGMRRATKTWGGEAGIALSTTRNLRPRTKKT